MPLLRSFPRLLFAGIVGIAPLEALAQLSVDEVLISVEHRSQGNVPEGWFFLAEIVGAGIASARIEKPDGGFEDLDDTEALCRRERVQCAHEFVSRTVEA